METVRLALDWTPNKAHGFFATSANHTGFFIAKVLGHFAEEGLEVQISDPSTDAYSQTPAAKLAQGQVDYALAPSESVLAHRFATSPAPLRAVAAVLTKDATAIATLASSGIGSPRELDGKRYASYDARFEDHIVRSMIRNDGGKGNIEIVSPPKLGIWETIIKREADATWIFENWEGLEASMKGIELKTFKMEDYGIPYGYSPLVLINESSQPPAATTRRFLRAARKGFEFATSRPAEAAEILQTFTPPEASVELLRASQSWLSNGGFYVVEDVWGKMAPTKWRAWVNWLRTEGLLKHRDGSEIADFSVESLFTNEFLD
ncbi:hypothetical protein LTR66_001689 [Elasticomyces elasticus]|nr:hypothetical protein LTR66_001689 [Elasticomyces elasticus]